MGETLALTNARIEVEERPGYLYMVEHGTLRSGAEVTEYAAAMELLVERTGIRRALIDSRQSDPVEPPREVRDAMWAWLLGARGFEQIAFVLGNEMHVARVNMTALSQRANIKAFAAVHEAHRWLTGRSRTLSQGMPAVSGGTIAPPRTPTPPPSAPRSSTPPPAMTTRSTATTRTGEISLAQPPLPATTTGRFQAQRSPSQSGLPRQSPKSDIVPAVRDDDDGARDRKSDKS